MRRRKKNSGGAVFAIVLLAVAIVCALLVLRGLFVVRNVVIDGETTTTETEIIRMSQIEMGGAIFSVDDARIKQNLESSGMIALDSVEVKYPNAVILHVRERTRDAMVLNGGQIVVLDSDGYVIEVCRSMPENSGVFVSGLEGTGYRVGGRIKAPEKKLEALKIITEAVRTQNAAEYISEVNMDDLLNLWIVTRTGIRVELGDVENMEGKILWLRSAVNDLEQRGSTTGTLDVSSGSKADYSP